MKPRRQTSSQLEEIFYQGNFTQQTDGIADEHLYHGDESLMGALHNLNVEFIMILSDYLSELDYESL